MKQLGYLEETGQILVACSEEEVRAFKYLAKVAQGKPVGIFVNPSFERLDAELAATLSAIGEWIELKDRANQLRRLAADIDAAIQKQSGDGNSET